MKIEKIDHKKFLGWLPLILSVVVIYQSVMLVNSLKRMRYIEQGGEIISNKKADDILVFGLKSDAKDFKLGQLYEMAVFVKSPKSVAVDGSDIFVKFNEEAFDVSDLKSADTLPSLAYKNISKATGIISAGVYITAQEGLLLNEGLETKLVTFKIKPKLEGNFVFNLTTRNDSKEFATMIVETQTKKVLPFAIEELEISVSK